MTSISNAVEQRKSDPTAMITQYTPDFATMLPSHIKPEQWARVAVGALRRDPNLMQAARNDPARLMSELAKAARLGLEPGTEEFYLTCRKEKGTNKVLGITGYQGMIELMWTGNDVLQAHLLFEIHFGLIVTMEIGKTEFHRNFLLLFSIIMEKPQCSRSGHTAAQCFFL